MKRKLLIISSIIIVLSIGLLGSWGYFNYFKPDPKIQEQLNNQFGVEFFNIDEEDLSMTNDGLTETESSINESTQKNPEQEKSLETSTPNVEADKTVEKITQDQIISKYMPQFNYLQNVALSRLDTLYSTAIQEYKNQRKVGSVNRSEIAQKYIQAGTRLEANVDSRFYKILSTMQEDLIANSLPTDAVSKIKTEYEKAKSDKRSQLLARALE